MRFFVALIALLFAGAAYAALPPQYYDQARDEAADVVVIQVRGVAFTSASSCAVEGEVRAIERGETYALGDVIVINMPCLGHAAFDPPVGSVRWQSSDQLRASRWGRAYLNGGELALYQYYALSEPPDSVGARAMPQGVRKPARG